MYTGCVLPCPAALSGVPALTACRRVPSSRPCSSLWGSGLSLSKKGACELRASLSQERSNAKQGLSRSRLVITAGKKDMKKAKAGGGAKGGPKGDLKSSGGSNFKSPGQVKDGSAYQTETRRTILTMHKVSKVVPSGKQILKNVSLGMYLGAKIGILGANGSGKSSLLKILAQTDKEFQGDCELVDGIKIGYLQQEPPLDDAHCGEQHRAGARRPARPLKGF